MINPLIFVPSVRKIPEVWNALESIPYDKFVTRMMLEDRAYQNGRDYFLDHKEYTHLVICPDDLVLTVEGFDILLRDIEKLGASNIAGISNIDEYQLDTYCCKPVGSDPSAVSKGSFYEKDTIPDANIFRVGFTGFSCQWLSRDLVKTLSFEGACNGGKGCMDLQFTREMDRMNEEQLVDKRALFYHMRNCQYKEVRAWKNRGHDPDEGFVFCINSKE